jgi:hypothetical protein
MQTGADGLHRSLGIEVGSFGSGVTFCRQEAAKSRPGELCNVAMSTLTSDRFNRVRKMVTVVIARATSRAMRSFHKVFSGALAELVVFSVNLVKTFNLGACPLTIRCTCRTAHLSRRLQSQAARQILGACERKR